MPHLFSEDPNDCQGERRHVRVVVVHQRLGKHVRASGVNLRWLHHFGQPAGSVLKSELKNQVAQPLADRALLWMHE